MQESLNFSDGFQKWMIITLKADGSPISDLVNNIDALSCIF